MHRAARMGDVRHSCADITKAKSVLKFEPTVSLRDGLAKTVAWWREEGIGR
jgi:nucleoside-diphosphate-sugar epimerase